MQDMALPSTDTTLFVKNFLLETVALTVLESVTPQTEAFQAIIWHLLVSHPQLKAMSTKWEGGR